MRLKISLSTFAAHLLLLVDALNLTKDENDIRKKECGKKFNYDVDNVSVILKGVSNFVMVHLNGKSGTESMGSFISRRHVITSAQMIISGNNNSLPVWAEPANEKFDESQNHCTKSKFIEIDKKHFKNIIVKYGECDRKMECNYQPAKPSKVFLLNMCNQSQDFANWNTLMLLDLGASCDHKSHLCVTGVSEGDVGTNAEVAIFELSGGYLKQRNTTLKSRSGRKTLKVDYYVSPKGRGSQMLKVINDRHSLIGIGASFGLKENEQSSTHFFEISQFEESICGAIGVCSGDPPTGATITIPGDATTPSTVASTPGSTSDAPPATPATATNGIIYYVTLPPEKEEPDEYVPPALSEEELESRTEQLDIPEGMEKKENEMDNDYQEGDLDYIDDLFVAPDFLNSATAGQLLMCLVLVIFYDLL